MLYTIYYILYTVYYILYTSRALRNYQYDGPTQGASRTNTTLWSHVTKHSYSIRDTLNVPPNDAGDYFGSCGMGLWNRGLWTSEASIAYHRLLGVMG